MAEMFIILAVSMIPQIKIPKDGITTDKHVIMLFRAYLPSTCMCLASVCRQLFLPGSDLQTNNEGQTQFYVSTPNTSHLKFLPLSTEPQASVPWQMPRVELPGSGPVLFVFLRLTWRRLSRAPWRWEDKIKLKIPAFDGDFARFHQSLHRRCPH